MEHSPRFQKVKDYYDRGLWNRTMVENAVDRWITRDECALILEQK